MKKITQNFYQAKNKRTSKVLFGLFALTLMSTQVTLGQQATGELPIIEGGFETAATPVTLGTSSSSLNIATNRALTTWTFGTTTNSNPVAINSTLVRSGAKSLDWTSNSTSAVMLTPTSPSGAIAANTSYVIQFYWWKNNAGTPRVLNFQMTADGSANFGTSVATAALGAADKSMSTTWTKTTVVVSTGAATPLYGFAQIKGGSFLNLVIDDFVIYQGSAPDATAPDAATAAVASVSEGGVDVSWTAPVAGVDGGGYLVVRYDSAPNADNDPSVNGIYSVGNTITNGTAALAGTVVYTGVGTHFADATGALSSHYKIYTVDKAFNYSEEVEPLQVNPLGVNEFKADSSANVYVNGNNVFISNVKSNTTVTVYSLTGALVKTVETSSDTSFGLGSGVWIAKVKSAEGEKSVKLLVK